MKLIDLVEELSPELIDKRKRCTMVYRLLRKVIIKCKSIEICTKWRINLSIDDLDLLKNWGYCWMFKQVQISTSFQLVIKN